MVLRLINKPPIFVDMPKFLFKRVVKDFVSRMITWSQKEYYDSIVELYATGHTQTARYLEDNCTPVDFLAHSTAFRNLLHNVDADIWTTLDRKTQNILIQAKNALGV